MPVTFGLQAFRDRVGTMNPCKSFRIGARHTLVRGSSVARLGALGLCVLIASCASVRTNVDSLPVKPEIVQSAVRFQKEYILFTGDQLEISVWRVPEMSRNVSIGPDGKVSLPLAQDVQAAGLTARELAEKLKAVLSSRLLNPEVTVIPVSIRQPVVQVLGDVRNPSPVPFRNAQTALQAISNAGGLIRSSAAADVTIIRLSSDGYLRAIPVEIEAGGQPGPYLGLGLVKLEPDDIVFVPESNRSQAIRFMQDFILQPIQALYTFKLFKAL